MMPAEPALPHDFCSRPANSGRWTMFVIRYGTDSTFYPDLDDETQVRVCDAP